MNMRPKNKYDNMFFILFNFREIKKNINNINPEFIIAPLDPLKAIEIKKSIRMIILLI